MGGGHEVVGARWGKTHKFSSRKDLGDPQEPTGRDKSGFFCFELFIFGNDRILEIELQCLFVSFFFFL